MQKRTLCWQNFLHYQEFCDEELLSPKYQQLHLLNCITNLRNMLSELPMTAIVSLYDGIPFSWSYKGFCRGQTSQLHFAKEDQYSHWSRDSWCFKCTIRKLLASTTSCAIWNSGWIGRIGIGSIYRDRTPTRIPASCNGTTSSSPLASFPALKWYTHTQLTSCSTNRSYNFYLSIIYTKH